MLNNQRFYQLSEPVRYRFKRLPLWAYLLIVLVTAYLGLNVVSLIGSIALIPILGLEFFFGDLPMTPTSFVGELVGGFLPIFFFVWFMLWLFEYRGLPSVGMQKEGALRNYGRGVLVGLGMFGSIVALMALLGFTAIESPFNGASVAGAFFVLLGWVVQGAGEEVLTRGLLLQVFGRTTNTLVGVLVSALFFAAIHLGNDNVSVLAIINLSAFGLFAALYTLYEGGLWGIFAIHSVWNWAQGNLFGFEVSGTVLESAIVLDLMETGPDLITGGPFGPEGGLVVTAVLLLGSGWLYFRLQETEVRSKAGLSK